MKEEKPLITIVVPIYKVEQYLENCIQSIIKQTYTNLQIILVDDGSPDNCGKICDEYALKDKRIEVVHQSNAGVSEARNIGISKAKGEYIGFVDSDDYIDENMYEEMYELLKTREADVCICNMYTVVNNKAEKMHEDEGIQEYNTIQILREILLDKKIRNYACNKLYKTSLFESIRYPKGKKYEDIGTTFYVLEKSKKTVVTGEPKYYYLCREGSIVNSCDEKTVIDYMEIVYQRYQYVEKKYPQLYTENRYYLVKILLVAYNDILKLGTVSTECRNLYNILYSEAKQIMLKYKENIIGLFDEEQRIKLDRIISGE